MESWKGASERNRHMTGIRAHKKSYQAWPDNPSFFSSPSQDGWFVFFVPDNMGTFKLFNCSHKIITHYKMLWSDISIIDIIIYLLKKYQISVSVICAISTFIEYFVIHSCLIVYENIALMCTGIKSEHILPTNKLSAVNVYIFCSFIS